MNELGRAGLGEYKEGRLRDTLRFSASLPGIERVTERPAARNHVRSEDGGLLFRAAARPFRDALEHLGLRTVARDSQKGVEFGWAVLSPHVLTRLFGSVRELLGEPGSALHLSLDEPLLAHERPPRPNLSSDSLPAGRIVRGRLVFDFEPGLVDQTRALIYAWRINDQDDALRYCYVGKAESGAARPLEHYARNVNNLLSNRPYRAGKPDRFRRVHKRLADAMEWGWPVILQLVRNVEPSEDIFAVETACASGLGFDHWPDHGRR
jgi:hypothetical protein